MNDEDVELLYPYVSADDFTYTDAKKASGNVAGLCTWCKAMINYTKVTANCRGPRLLAALRR